MTVAWSHSAILEIHGGVVSFAAALRARTDTNQVWVYYGCGAGYFSAPKVLTVGFAPYSVVAVDLNNDGHLDLVVFDRTDGTVTSLLAMAVGLLSHTAPIRPNSLEDP